jgi:hypothetical protein
LATAKDTIDTVLFTDGIKRVPKGRPKRPGAA